MRLEYETVGLNPSDLGDDPIAAFKQWLSQAVEADLVEPNAMVLSTVDRQGQPWSRHMLLKGVDDNGRFEFYTNYHSNKSGHLTVNPKAALTFGWLGLRRQINIGGTVQRVSPLDSDVYWSQRPRLSQLGALASDQSRNLDDRCELEQRFADHDANYPNEVPRPDHWGGWSLDPTTIEFWQGRPNRLHDRIRFERAAAGNWVSQRLNP